MSKSIDLTGIKFGRLTAIEINNFEKMGAYWKCKCSCGNFKIVLAAELRRGRTNSCGCLRKEITSKRGSKVGAENGRNGCTIHGFSGKRIYRAWQNMLNRCGKANNKSFKDYGGRGINVCAAWRDAETFIKWAMANGYQDNLTIDRRNNNGNYTPSNCRWITRSENISERNRRLKHARVSAQAD